jgi:hypothetical protein
MNHIVCESCGSSEIHIEVFVNVNTGTPEDDLYYLQGKAINSDCWCKCCQAMVNALEHEEYKLIVQDKETHLEDVSD